jgi:hypothetical protein
MSGPWEKFQAPAPSDGPWTKFKSSAPSSPDEIVDEEHPGFTFGDRFTVKNLSNDQGSAVRYLQKQHPDLEVKAGNDGQILARGKGEKSYRVLDPSGFDLQDITDLLGDAVQGGLSGLATVGGGIVGNLPGAVAAGGASNAGLDYLKQKIGQALGVNDDVKGSSVALAGVGGAVAPALLGSGAAAGAASRGLIQRLAGVGAEEAAPAVEQAAVKAVYDPFTKTVTQKAAEATAPTEASALSEALQKAATTLAQKATGSTVGYHVGSEVGEAVGGHKGRHIGALLEASLVVRLQVLQLLRQP